MPSSQFIIHLGGFVIGYQWRADAKAPMKKWRR
jgi:hypothetical protein